MAVFWTPRRELAREDKRKQLLYPLPQFITDFAGMKLLWRNQAQDRFSCFQTCFEQRIQFSLYSTFCQNDAWMLTEQASDGFYLLCGTCHIK